MQHESACVRYAAQMQMLEAVAMMAMLKHH